VLNEREGLEILSNYKRADRWVEGRKVRGKTYVMYKCRDRIKAPLASHLVWDGLVAV
jgi:hypothetical protein